VFISFYVVFMCYIIWESEMRKKKDFVSMGEIKKINNELQTIMTSYLPDGIVLIADKDSFWRVGVFKLS